MAGFLTATSGRITTLVFGIIVLAFGLHSHFTSSWIAYKNTKLYRLCKRKVDGCPDIRMEHFYIAVIIICFTLSKVGLVLSFAIKNKKSKLIDMIFHWIAALLLLAAGIVYIVSAVKIEDLLGKPIKDHYQIDGRQFKLNLPDLLVRADEDDDFDLKTSEKIAAGTLTIFLAILYGVAALLILRKKDSAHAELK